MPAGDLACGTPSRSQSSGVGTAKSTTWHKSAHKIARRYGGVPPVQLAGSDFRLPATTQSVSTDVGEDALQFIQGAVADDQLSLALLTMPDLHRKRPGARQALFQAGVSGSLLTGPAGLPGHASTAEPGLRSDVRSAHVRQHVAPLPPAVLPADRGAGTGMAHLQVAMGSRVLISSGRPIQAQRVGKWSRETSAPTTSATCCWSAAAHETEEYQVSTLVMVWRTVNTQI